MDVVANAKP